MFSFFFWSIFYVFNYKKLFIRLFFTNLFEAGSGSAFKKQLDPDPHGDKLPDPDPQKINVDPQPWFHLYFSLIFIYFGKVHLQGAGQKREEGGDRRGKERRRGLAQVSQEQGQPQVWLLGDSTGNYLLEVLGELSNGKGSRSYYRIL